MPLGLRARAVSGTKARSSHADLSISPAFLSLSIRTAGANWCHSNPLEQGAQPALLAAA